MSKARRSFEVAVALRAGGFPTPEPLLVWEHYGPIAAQKTEQAAAYVCADCEPCVQIRVLHGEEWISGHRALALATLGDRQAVIAGCGALAARLHEAGWLHRDFTAGNVLVRQEPDGAWAFELVDLNRMRQGRISLRQGLASLVQLEFSSESDLNCLLQAYCQVRGVAVADAAGYYRALLRRHLWWFAMKNRTRGWRRRLNPLR